MVTHLAACPIHRPGDRAEELVREGAEVVGVWRGGSSAVRSHFMTWTIHVMNHTSADRDVPAIGWLLGALDGTSRHGGALYLILIGMARTSEQPIGRLRVGQAAEMLGVSVETLRRWETEGRLHMMRSEGGQRLIEIDEVARLLDERRKAATDRPIVAQSARNRFPGIITRVERDGVAAVVEVIAGPHRLVSLMTAEAVEELDLKVGDEAVCVVKATNVIVEIPSPKESRA
jgi:molybdopterin-binding protein